MGKGSPHRETYDEKEACTVQWEERSAGQRLPPPELKDGYTPTKAGRVPARFPLGEGQTTEKR